MVRSLLAYHAPQIAGPLQAGREKTTMWLDRKLGARKGKTSSFRRTVTALALGAALACPAVLAGGDGSGIAQAIAQAIAALQKASQQTQAAIQKIEQQTQAALGKIIGQSGGGLGQALQHTIATMELIIKEANPNYINPTAGTTAARPFAGRTAGRYPG